MNDIVLMSSPWRGLQNLFNIIEKAASSVDMMFNTAKTVCMVMCPYDRRRMVSQSFLQFEFADCKLSYDMLLCLSILAILLSILFVMTMILTEN